MFEWDIHNRRHIARHGFTPEAIEHALSDPFAVEYQSTVEAGEERIVILCRLASGRIITVVITFRDDRTRVLTAFPADRVQQRLYMREGG